MSPFANLLLIFTEPGRAMANVRERSMIALPLLLMMLGTAAMMAWYYQVVDFAWLRDLMLSANPDLGPEQREQAAEFMSRSTMMAFAVVGAIIGTLIALLLSAVYYLLAGKVIGSEFGFGKWFAFATWAGVPTLLLIPLMAMQILMAGNGQLAPDALNPVSLNSLLLHASMDSPWYSFGNALNLTTLWSIAVAIVGFRRWTDRSPTGSAVIVLLPYVVIFGGWALIAALRGGA